MSYHDAMKRLAWNGDDDRPLFGGGDRGDYLDGDLDDGSGDDGDLDDGSSGPDDDDLDDVGRLRERITDAMPEGDPEAYMASGQELLDELLAHPDREKLSLILDKEIEELIALLGGDMGGIDLAMLKETAMQAFDDAAKSAGPSRGAVLSALAAIREGGAKALRSLGLMT